MRLLVGLRGGREWFLLGRQAAELSHPACFGVFRLRHISLVGADEAGHRTFGYSLEELDSRYSAFGLFGITSDRL